ncbi:hypothetical protein BKA58DRAFT_469329 [Alternaria rosae]|uniref:uncharacterized protein n=1 Tax=Alternaria rosae TaxID=1187941 RepID=UPI001E8CEAF6|nr:uncharacterized protein BKA58DRAFT_469329 [Alternaria rosae]KAH6870289.1 hypothetical protein BKA58DRAFT_469329 [Alternaria rosae]
MAALTHSQDVFYNLDDMSVILHIHTYDETLLQLLAIGPTDSQQISKPIDSTYTGQQLSPEQCVYHTSGSDKTSLEEAHACTIPSPAQHIAQPPTFFLETFLNRYGKTQMPTYPNTAHPPLPSQIPNCKSAANTQRESVTTSAARSVRQPTTHGNESANTLLGSSRSENPGDSIQSAACVSAIAGSSSPEGATNHPGQDQDDQQSSPRSGIVHVTAKTFERFPLSAYLRPYRRPIPVEKTPDDGIPLTILDEPEQIFPIRDEHWHSTAVIKRSFASYWADMKESKTEKPDGLKDPASNDASLRKPELRRWWTPEKSLAESLKEEFAKYRIRNYHVAPLPSQKYTRSKQNFLIWAARPEQDKKLVEEYRAFLALLNDDIQPTTTGTLRGGAGTPEPSSGGPLGEDDEFEHDMPAGDDFYDSTEVSAEDQPLPGSPGSVSSGYSSSSDISAAASEHFHEQNNLQQTWEDAAAAAGPAEHPSSAGSLESPWHDSDYFSHSPFQFETTPLTGSRDPSRSHSMDIEPYTGPPNDSTSSVQYTPYEGPSERQPLIQRHVPGGVPPAGYTYDSTEEDPLVAPQPPVASQSPVEPQQPAWRHRRNRVAQVIRQYRLRAGFRARFTRFGRSLLVMGSKEGKELRKKDK